MHLHVDHRCQAVHAHPPFGSPGPSRRPLPTPRARPESMPPPPRQPPLVVQSPAPSRPAILAPSAALATSPTATPARRPLPTPALSPPKPTTKHSSIDLTARPASPVKSAISTANTDPDRDLRIPSSFSRRTAPLPDANHPPSGAPFSTPPPTWPNPHETHRTPLWNRNVPSAHVAPNVIERRSTVSGTFPPAALQPRSNPPRAQSPHRLQSSPTRRPLPSSPTDPPRVPLLVSTSSQDDRAVSSPSDRSSLSHHYAYEPITFADPQAEDDEDRGIVLPRGTDTASPTFGIRDLPPRSWIAIANRGVAAPSTQHEQTTRQRPVRSVTLPQPPSPDSQTQLPRAPVSPPASGTFPARSPPSVSPPSEPQSLTLRFAAMGLAEERAREKEKHAMSSPSPVQSPTRTAPGPASPVRQQHAWPINVPPLPRTPGNTTRPVFGATDIPMKNQPFKQNGTSSPSLPTSPTHSVPPLSSSPGPQTTFDRKPFAQQHHPQSQSQQAPQLTARQLEKQRARDTDIDLDDAPPPSLRRSPSPIRQGFARTPAIEITNDTPPRRQWTPAQDLASRTGNASLNGTGGSHPGHRAASRSPERRGQPLPQPYAQLPTQPPTPSRQAVIPKISLPDGIRDDGGATDGNDAHGPSIVVSGPGDGSGVSISTPSTPAISVSETSGILHSEHTVPAISVSAAPNPSATFSPPKISVSDSGHTQRPGPSPGSFGSRHTQFQESSPLHTPPGRGPVSKRGLPSPPSSLNPVRTNGLSCGGCSGSIIGRIVSAMGQRWHPNCFRCSLCNELLEHVSSYERDGKPYCHLDYHEAFAPRCFHCKTAIIDERFITLDDPALGKRTYHEQHFFCAECGDPFLAPSDPLLARTGELNLAGDGEFVDDDVGFTVYKGHPYCEACHVRLRMPKCKACKKSIRDGVRAVEALGGKWCWSCFVCEACKKPFEDPAFFLRNEKPFCEPCFSLILRNEV